MVEAFNIRGRRWQGFACSGSAARRDGQAVAVFETLKVDLTVVLGRARMPLHMLLRMGRGAVIELEASDSDMVEILANDHPIARGQIVVTGDRISVEVTELIRKAAAIVEPGTTIGDSATPFLDDDYASV
jgi:flagellar motor switch protein FliN/FliY